MIRHYLPSSFTRLFAIACIAILSILSLNLPTALVKAQSGINNDPSFLQIYANNVENLVPFDFKIAGCRTDWEDLISYMKSQVIPDLYVAQQLSGLDQAQELATYMSKELGTPYAVVVAEKQPEKHTSDCEFTPSNEPTQTPKAYQTNVILYRTERLRLIDTVIWQSKTYLPAPGLPGQPIFWDCVDYTPSRIRNVRALFYDNVAQKHVSAASIHWPTAEESGHGCAEKNAKITDNEIRKYTADLYVFGGSANITDLNTNNKWQPWYKTVNGELSNSGLGYRDVIYEFCRPRDDDTTAGIKTCTRNNWTFAKERENGNIIKRRIDFLFAKRGDREMPFVSEPHTVTFEEANNPNVGANDSLLNYSDHRAMRAHIYY